METAKDFKRDDAFQTEWQHNQEEAHGECIDKAGELTMSVEHLVSEKDNSVDIINIVEVYTAVQKIVNLRFYEFSATVEGKYQVYDKTFEYDFSEALMGLLEDTLGHNFEELFV
jgi:ABC-type transporter MlaC component